MPVPPNQPQQRPATAVPTQNIMRIPLEQFDVKALSRDKIRELFRVGKLPTADQIVEEVMLRAITSGANDIHIEPIEGELQIRFGLEGALRRIVSHTRYE